MNTELYEYLGKPDISQKLLDKINEYVDMKINDKIEELTLKYIEYLQDYKNKLDKELQEKIEEIDEAVQKYISKLIDEIK